VKLTRHTTKHPRRAALCFAMCTTQSMHVRVHVFLGHREKLRTIFQRGFHRKLKDQARRPVPSSVAVPFFLGSALAYCIGRFEQLTPASFGCTHHLAAALDETRAASLRETRTSDHEAIVANPDSGAQTS